MSCEPQPHVSRRTLTQHVLRVRPDCHPVDAEPPTDGDDALVVQAGSSDSVHLTLRQGCSSSSPRVRDHPRLAVSGSLRLFIDAEFRLIPRRTQPLEPLPGVRFESTRVHQIPEPRDCLQWASTNENELAKTVADGSA